MAIKYLEEHQQTSYQ